MRSFEGWRILVVEDQFIVAMSLKDLLTEMGAQVVGPALTLKHAMELARTAVLDAAVLDLWLGEEPSYPVGEILAIRDIPFVIASGFAKRDEPERLRHAPRVLKPFTAVELRDALMLARGGTA